MRRSIEEIAMGVGRFIVDCFGEESEVDTDCSILYCLLK